MPNPIFILRSNVTGVRPTGKQPGEPYVNWADKAFGVTDALGSPLDLVAVRHFSTLASYVIGDHVIEAGVLYVAIAASVAGAFVPANWAAFPIGDFLPLTGGTLTGDLIMAAPSAIKGQLAGLDTFSVHLGAEFIVNEYDAAGVAYKAFNIYQNSRVAGFYGGRLNIRDDAVLIAGDPVILRLESRLPQPTTYCSIQGAIQGAVWQIKMPDETPRTGGNVGGNFLIHAFNDTGTPLPTALSIERATGKTTLSTMPSIPGGAAGNTITTDGAGTLSWSPATDLSGYLPLTGGTLTGQLAFADALVTAPGDLSRHLSLYTGCGFSVSGTPPYETLNVNSPYGFNFYGDGVFNAGLGLGGLSVGTGPININPNLGTLGAAQLYLIKTVGTYENAIQACSGVSNAPRWKMVLGDAVAEAAGTDAGSNFYIGSYDDAGLASGTPLTIERATGITTLSAPPIVPAIDINAPAGTARSIFGRVGTLTTTVEAKEGEEAVQYPAVPGAPRWEMQLGDETAAGDFKLKAYDDAGVEKPTPSLSIRRSYGEMTVPGGVFIDAARTMGFNGAGGNVNYIGTAVFQSGAFIQPASGHASLTLRAPVGGNSVLTLQRDAGKEAAIDGGATTGRRWQLLLADANPEVGANAGSDLRVNQYSDGGTLIGTPLTIERATGQATFSMPILETSDVSTKTNITPVDAALDIVSRLTGVFYNQNGGTKRQVGLIAQDTQEALPEVVFQSPPTTNEAGEQSEGLLGVAYGNVVAVLVNAVKELTAKVTALESAAAGLGVASRTHDIATSVAALPPVSSPTASTRPPTPPRSPARPARR